ncbi:hypothetical protein KUTeg_006000 [Tegillarca granosa]|uniref:Novel STAND NTPase 3 domain-containing protein n=1 Tax=Tegillarca granosa TaxID=220873 RepID=A0ABQ9FII0_TEGGR|nr:hypothetical protein KUTeg_006000 [Tegillarca granosa]
MVCMDLIDHKLGRWKEDDKAYAVTRLTIAVRTEVDTNDIIMVTGPPGSGKSATIHHIALELKESGYRVCPVENFCEITQYWTPDMSQVFIYDDPFGVHGIDEAEVNMWRKKQEDLKTCFENSRMKIFFSIRTHMNKDLKMPKITESFKHKTFSATEKTLELNDIERSDIFNKHIENQKRDDLKTMTKEIKTYKIFCFPLLCRLFCADEGSKYRVDDFFQKPLEVIVNEVTNFQLNDPLRYFCLLFCVIYDNELSLDVLDRKNKCETTQTLREELLDVCNLEKSTSINKIKDTLQTLESTFLVKEGSKYQFIHDVINDAVVKQIAESPEKVLEILIEYCSAKFLRTRVFLDNMATDVEECIVLAASLERTWGKRILYFIEHGFWHDVFNNKCLLTDKGDSIINAELTKYSKSKIEKIMCDSNGNEVSVNLNVLDGNYEIDKQIDQKETNALHFAVMKGLVGVVTTTINAISSSAKKKIK